MKIAITVQATYPKNSKRPPTVMATAHLPGTSPRSTPSLAIEIRPRPGATEMDVAASVFCLREPFMIEVDDDDGFFHRDLDAVRSIVLNAVREAVRAIRSQSRARSCSG